MRFILYGGEFDGEFTNPPRLVNVQFAPGDTLSVRCAHCNRLSIYNVMSAGFDTIELLYATVASEYANGKERSEWDGRELLQTGVSTL